MKRTPENTRTKLLDAAYAEVYTHGYHGASTANILKTADVPKGSMYHFFSSKKELILTVIKERIFPNINSFFKFERHAEESVLDAVTRIFVKMSRNDHVIKNGCPMFRLIVEMASLDKDFDELLASKMESIIEQVALLLQEGIEIGEFQSFDAKAMARFILTATWGELSVMPRLSSQKHFSTHTSQILRYLKSYQN